MIPAMGTRGNVAHSMRLSHPRRRRERTAGQALVEFALIIPLFLVMLIGIVEFSLAFNALLGTNYASREAALIAAEAGNGSGADCSILAAVERSITAPADPRLISEVRIYRSDQNGNAVSGAVNVYDRSGTTTCTLADGSVVTVPYQIVGTAGYPSVARCNVLAGCGGTQTTVDQIGVQATYIYSWHTPLNGMLSLAGTGFTLVQSNAMRMEPVL